MAQHIGVVKVDEKGNLIEKLDVNFADVMNALQEFNNFSIEFPLIASIDPYGSTVFNSAQVLLVKKELEKILIGAPKLGKLAGKLISMLEKIGTHQYIKFIGD